MQAKASRKGVRFYQQLIDDEKNQNSISSNVKGRSAELVSKRNKCIICRFYYYVKEKNLRYKDVIALLSEEFFLAQRTIINIVVSTSSMPGCSYNEMKEETKRLQLQYAFLNWRN